MTVLVVGAGFIGTPVVQQLADPLPLVADLSCERARREFDYDLTPLADAIRDHGERV